MFSALFRAAEKAKATGQEYVTVVEDQRPLRTALKLAIGSWVTYKLGVHFANSDTMLVDSTMVLARSQKPEYRAEGVHRIDQWHTSENATKAVVERGGVDLMLAALDAREATTRLEALNAIVRMASIDAAREALISGDAAARARASCVPLSDADAAERCQSLAQNLAVALGEATS